MGALESMVSEFLEWESSTNSSTELHDQWEKEEYI